MFGLEQDEEACGEHGEPRGRHFDGRLLRLEGFQRDVLDFGLRHKVCGHSSKSARGRVGAIRSLFEQTGPRPQRDERDAREDEQRGDQGARPAELLRAEDERRDGEGDERLQVDVDRDGARGGAFERPGV